MYPFIRTALVMRRARRRPDLPIDGLSELQLTCWPIDVDIYAEMNNGRVLTLYDLGRLDQAVRTGMTARARQHGWGFAVGGASVRYRRRVRPFDKVTLLTRPLGRDDRWFYMHQAMQVRGEAVSAALLRLAVTTRGGIVPTDEVVAAMGAATWRPALPDWVEAWIAAEDRRPWPPELT